MHSMFRRFTSPALVLLALFPLIAAAARGDHPLVGRTDTAFDEVEVVNGPIASARGIGAPGWQRLEGKIHVAVLPPARGPFVARGPAQLGNESQGQGVPAGVHLRH